MPSKQKTYTNLTLADKFLTELEKEYGSHFTDYPVPLFERLTDQWSNEGRISSRKEPDSALLIWLEGMNILSVKGAHDTIDYNLKNDGREICMEELPWIEEALLKAYGVRYRGEISKRRDRLTIGGVIGWDNSFILRVKGRDWIDLTNGQYIDMARLAKRNDLVETAKDQPQARKVMVVRTDTYGLSSLGDYRFTDGSRIGFKPSKGWGIKVFADKWAKCS